MKIPDLPVYLQVGEDGPKRLVGYLRIDDILENLVDLPGVPQDTDPPYALYCAEKYDGSLAVDYPKVHEALIGKTCDRHGTHSGHHRHGTNVWGPGVHLTFAFGGPR